MRPFVLGAKVNPLGCSRPLQRAIPGSKSPGTGLRGRSALRAGARQVAGAPRLRDRREHDPADHVRPRPGDARKPSRGSGISGNAGPRKPIVVETDGGMVPIVEPNSEGKDKRKGKTLSWREAKLSLAHAQGSRTPVYAGSIEGGVEEAGRQLLCLTRFAPASGRTPGFTRSATARPGSSVTPGSKSPGEAAVRRSRLLPD